MSENKNITINPDQIHVQAINVLKSNISISPDMVNKNISGYNIEFEVGNGMSTESGAVKIFIRTNLQAIDDNGNPVDVTIEFASEFILTVDNLTDYIIKDDENPEQLVLHGLMNGTLVGIAYSTFRGMVFSNTQSILNSGVILPVLDPLKLLPGKIHKS